MMTDPAFDAALAEPAPDPDRHEHRPEYPSSCTGCEHLAADLAARLPEGLLPHRAAPDLLAADLATAIRKTPELNEVIFDGGRKSDIDIAKRLLALLRAAPSREADR